MARPFDEPRMFRIAYAYEQLTRLRACVTVLFMNSKASALHLPLV